MKRGSCLIVFTYNRGKCPQQLMFHITKVLNVNVRIFNQQPNEGKQEDYLSLAIIQNKVFTFDSLITISNSRWYIKSPFHQPNVFPGPLENLSASGLSAAHCIVFSRPVTYEIHGLAVLFGVKREIFSTDRPTYLTLFNCM